MVIQSQCLATERNPFNLNYKSDPNPTRKASKAININ